MFLVTSMRHTEASRAGAPSMSTLHHADQGGFYDAVPKQYFFRDSYNIRYIVRKRQFWTIWVPIFRLWQPCQIHFLLYCILQQFIYWFVDTCRSKETNPPVVIELDSDRNVPCIQIQWSLFCSCHYLILLTTFMTDVEEINGILYILQTFPISMYNQEQYNWWLPKRCLSLRWTNEL